jgi:hypothetical protein
MSNQRKCFLTALYFIASLLINYGYVYAVNGIISYNPASFSSYLRKSGARTSLWALRLPALCHINFHSCTIYNLAALMLFEYRRYGWSVPRIRLRSRVHHPALGRGRFVRFRTFSRLTFVRSRGLYDRLSYYPSQARAFSVQFPEVVVLSDSSRNRRRAPALRNRLAPVWSVYVPCGRQLQIIRRLNARAFVTMRHSV